VGKRLGAVPNPVAGAGLADDIDIDIDGDRREHHQKWA
jgi:hypothetical protein